MVNPWMYGLQIFNFIQSDMALYLYDPCPSLLKVAEELLGYCVLLICLAIQGSWVLPSALPVL